MIYGHAIGGGGGGKSGATLSVTAPVGSTVTVSKGSEIYSSGLRPAVFKGLSTGTWVIDYTNGPQVGQQTIDITADYAISVSYFAATINITYPAGSTCTVSKDGTTLTAPDTSGTWACVVNSAGAWTVTATDGTNTKSESVEITASGENKTVTLSYRRYLFEPGNPHTELTGGWIKNGSGGIVSDESLTVRGDSAYSSSSVYTNNTVSFTGYSTINFRLSSAVTNTGGQAAYGVGIADKSTFSVKGSLPNYINITEATDYSVDLGTVNSGLPKLYAKQGTNYSTYRMVCTHVWLE